MNSLEDVERHGKSLACFQEAVVNSASFSYKRCVILNRVGF